MGEIPGARISTERGELLERIERLEDELAEARAELVRADLSEEARTRGARLLLFSCGDSTLALSLESVEEVVPIAKLLELLDAPSWLAGLLDLRGTLVPVVDLTLRLRGAPRAIAAEDAIVVCSHEGRPVGLWVEGIPMIFTAEPGGVEVLLAERTVHGAIAGVVRAHGLLADLLSLSRLFASSPIPEVAS